MADAPTQDVYVITYKDGRVEKVPFGPLELYEAAELGNTSVLGLSYAAAWIAAGRPEDDLKKWLAGVYQIREEQQPVPLKGGTKR